MDRQTNDRQIDRQTDRQTDGRAIAYSEREREFAFAMCKFIVLSLELFILLAVAVVANVNIIWPTWFMIPALTLATLYPVFKHGFIEVLRTNYARDVIYSTSTRA